MKIALVGEKTYPERWLPRLRERLPKDRIYVHPAIPNPAEVEVALVGAPRPGDLAGLPGLKLVQCLWMGVDELLRDPGLPAHAAVARMVDPSMVRAMVEMVVAYALDYHRALYMYRRQQAERNWQYIPQRLAAERRVGILGLGELGRAAAARLKDFGFQVSGWSRRPKNLQGIDCHAGDAGLHEMLPCCDLVVFLLPLTPQTRGLIARPLLNLLKSGTGIVSLGRGAQMVTADVISALDSGRIGHAYLDVFEEEPLPRDHPLWRHAKVTVTPHMAARTEPATAIDVAVANIERVRRGEAPHHLVDRQAGY